MSALVGWSVFPWFERAEETLDCEARCKWNGDVNGKGSLLVVVLCGKMVSECVVGGSDGCNTFVKSQCVEPLWRGKVVDLGNPDFVSEGAYGGVERGKPGREEKVSVALIHGACKHKVSFGRTPGVVVEFNKDTLD